MRSALVLGSVLLIVGCKSGGGAADGGGGQGASVGGAGGASGGAQGGSSAGSSGGAGSSGSPGAGGTFAGVHAVQGTNGHAGTIVDQNGNVLVLHGADESGTENYCITWGPPPIVISPQGGPSPLTQDSLTAMKSWGLNTGSHSAQRGLLAGDQRRGRFRRWRELPGADSRGGQPHHEDQRHVCDPGPALVGPGTTLAAAQGTMPDLDYTVAFWQQVAAAYKDNGSVIFDLFNEPVMASGSNDQQFACWKNGNTTAAGGDCPMVNFAVAGMQQLLTAVRSVGADNLVIIGGIGYSSQLGLWPTYVPTDTLSPPNLAASWHVYDDQGGCTADGPTTIATLCGPSGLGGRR